MENNGGETAPCSSAGQPCPAPFAFPPMTTEQLAALERFLQRLFKSVTTAILVFFAGGVGTSEVTHPSNHNAGGHKVPPITNTTRRADRGEAGVEIQQVEDDDNPSGPPPVPCEALGVGCVNRVPSGFCHFRQHLCIVAPHPDSIMELHQKMDQVLQKLNEKSEKGLADGHREPVSGEVARQAFALLQKLELDAPLKAPSVLTVFRLYCVDGYSAERVARKCRCAKGTVMSRLRFIETVTQTKPEEFRAVSGHLQQMEDDLRSSGAREIYRRGLVDDRED